MAEVEKVEPTIKTPREVAEGAINRLCVFDIAELDWMATAKRVAEFQSEFSLLAADRLATVARRQQHKLVTGSADLSQSVPGRGRGAA